MAGGSFRILIVDDNANNLFTLRALLARLPDCEIIEAMSGIEALAATVEHRIHLVLLDVQMPEMDGYETARHLKMAGRTRDIPIIFVTAVFTAREFIERGYQIGAVDYLTKPIDDNLLLNRVGLYRRLMEREHQLSEALEVLRLSDVRLSQRHQLILESAGEGIFGFDTGGCATFINPAALRLLGYREDQVLGRDLRRLVLPAEDSPGDDPLTACLETGTAKAMKNQTFRCFDGSPLPVDYVATPIAEEGAVTGAVVVFHDISDWLEAEARLQNKNDELKRSNAELEAFGYVASHDLREPLRNVMHYCTLLARKLGERLDDDERDFLGFIQSGAQRMDQLVLDLLNYSRVGRICDPIAEVSMQSVLDSVLGQMQAQLRECHAEVTVESELPIVFASANELERVIMNLLGNTLKYRLPDHPPRVLVDCALENDMWHVFFKDDGIGIPPGEGYEERIFRLFQRLHQREEYGGGTGVGLAVCKKIIERHGGRIWAESKGVGQGSTFNFTLPVHG